MRPKPRTVADAELLARQALGRDGASFALQLVEHPFGWIVHYGPSSGAPLFGNAPLLVDRDGSVHVTGTGRPLDVYTTAYARFGADVYDARAWELAIERQERRQRRAEADARREHGGSVAEGAREVAIDWAEVARELASGPTPEVIAPPTRCYACDAYLPPRKAIQGPVGPPLCGLRVQALAALRAARGGTRASSRFRLR